jgi:hypothetical protein
MEKVSVRLAIILGPYRNLSTLSAAILSLHPDCQVLNHAAHRLLADSSINFFTNVEAETFDRFLQAAREASGGGERGGFGGSILHSHAYANSPLLKSLYYRRYGDQALKPHAACLVWKDSMRIQRRLMWDDILFDRLCTTFPDLRFFMPIRNPLDCAVSNVSTGAIEYLTEKRNNVSLERAIDLVLDAYAWVLNRRDYRPDRIFVFTQYDERPTVFGALADFLHLTRYEDWIRDATEAFRITREYQHSAETVDYTRSATRARLKHWPDIVRRLGY